MAFAILGTPKPAFFDSSGSPLVSGTITIQDPTDDSVKASYPTAADADASTNGTSGDITLDARGEPTSTQLWGRTGEDYKIIIKDSAGATIYTITGIVLAGNERAATVTFSSGDATPSIATSSRFITAGTTQISDFDDGVVGDTIRVYANSVISIQDSASIALAGGLSYKMGVGDTLTLTMFVDQLWEEVGRKSVNGGPPIAWEYVSATNTLLQSENGKVLYLNAAGGFTTTLPGPFVGGKFTFIVKAAPTTAYIINTSSSQNVMYGTTIDITDTVSFVAQDTMSFVASTSLIGDSVTMESDGISWFCRAFSAANNGITTGQT